MTATDFAAAGSPEELALKLAWPAGQVQDEADALTAWQGRGASS